MRKTAIICEKWTMALDKPEDSRDTWFLDWVLRSPKQAGRHLTAGYRVYGSLLAVYDASEIRSAQEYFGGMGAQSLMIQDIFNPVEHVVTDYSDEAVQHLQRVLPSEDHQVFQADAYAESFWGSPDLVGLDFGDLTVWKTREGEDQRGLLDRVFSKEPKAVVFTDIACRYLHLHRERYETLLGPNTCGSYRTYLEAFLNRLEGLYGYRLVTGCYDTWSAVMALVPEGAFPDVGELVPTPSWPVGLELL
jgi:hypothetical protein